MARFRVTYLAATSFALCGGLALGGCGSTARPVRHVDAFHAARGVNARAGGSELGIGSRASRLFSASSFWNRPLAPGAPLASSSPRLVAALVAEVSREQSERRGPWINTTEFGVPILTVPADQATVPVQLDHAPDSALSAAWSAVPLPATAEPAAGSDKVLVLWQPSTDRMWEFWRLNRQEDGWHASWGGAMSHVSTSRGVYATAAWPGAKPWWGATASSLALAGGVMTIEELASGHIEHALAIAVPDVRAGVFASPAQRTDGVSTDPAALPEGAHLRLDPNLDLASLEMPPFTRMLALAAQRYGIVVRDFASNVAFIAQDPPPTERNPYSGPSGFFEGLSPSRLLVSFPWTHLQVLRMVTHRSP